MQLITSLSLIRMLRIMFRKRDRRTVVSGRLMIKNNLEYKNDLTV